jgi:hypothetical protein
VDSSNLGIEIGLSDSDLLWFSSDSKLTPENSILEKLTVAQLVKFSACYRTQKFLLSSQKPSLTAYCETVESIP